MGTEDFDFILVVLHFDNGPSVGHVGSHQNVAFASQCERALHILVFYRESKRESDRASKDASVSFVTVTQPVTPDSAPALFRQELISCSVS